MDKELMAALAPKTDQLNSDDLFGIESLAVTIKGPVTVLDGKLSIPLEEVKPYKPSKGMGRIIMAVFGERKNWPGEKLRLYRDPKVRYAGVEVGGIKISEASGVESETTFMVTLTRGKKIPHIVKPFKSNEDIIAPVMVAFRQAQTLGEIDDAKELTKGFDEEQKRLLITDYNDAVARVNQKKDEEK